MLKANKYADWSWWKLDYQVSGIRYTIHGMRQNFL